MSDIKHTPEPWKFHEQGDANQFCITTADGKGWVIGLILNGEMHVEKQRATLKRIVACVNYCADVHPDRLTEDSLSIKLAHIGQLEADRTRLVAALTAAEGALTRASNDMCVVCPGGAREAQTARSAISDVLRMMPKELL